MKRSIVLLLTAILLLGAAGQAFAVDIAVKGRFDFAWGFTDGVTLREGLNEDDFVARSRVRTQIDFIASESLKGVLHFEIGNYRWGRNGFPAQSAGVSGQGAGGDLDTDGVNIETKHAYIDWFVPNTKLQVRMGLQMIALPATVTQFSTAFTGDVAGISASYKFDNGIGLTGFWARPYDTAETINGGNTYDAMDMFGLLGSYRSKTVTVLPWLMYSNIGNNTDFWRYRTPASSKQTNYILAPAYASGLGTMTGDSEMYHAGIGFAITPMEDTPLTFKFDGVYGILNNESGAAEFNGWQTQAAIEYKATWGTPGIFGWYASGDDADAAIDKDYGRLPIVNSDPGWTMTSFGSNDVAALTHIGVISSSGVGTWGIGAGIKDVSFIDDLTHQFRVAWWQGTNNVENVQVAKTWTGGTTPNQRLAFMGETHYLTTSDGALEFNFNTNYKISANLLARFELAYVRNYIDDEVWNNPATGDSWFDKNDAIKGQLLLYYFF